MVVPAFPPSFPPSPSLSLSLSLSLSQHHRGQFDRPPSSRITRLTLFRLGIFIRRETGFCCTGRGGLHRLSLSECAHVPGPHRNGGRRLPGAQGLLSAPEAHGLSPRGKAPVTHLRARPGFVSPGATEGKGFSLI